MSTGKSGPIPTISTNLYLDPNTSSSKENEDDKNDDHTSRHLHVDTNFLNPNTTSARSRRSSIGYNRSISDKISLTSLFRSNSPSNTRPPSPMEFSTLNAEFFHKVEEDPEFSFIDNLAEAEDTIALKNDLKSIIEEKNFSNTWLRKTSSRNQQSFNQSSTVSPSLDTTDPEQGIELSNLEISRVSTVANTSLSDFAELDSKTELNLQRTKDGEGPSSGALKQLKSKLKKYNFDGFGYGEDTKNKGQKTSNALELDVEGQNLSSNDPFRSIRLYGNSLKYFGPNDWLRNYLANLLMEKWVYHVLRSFIVLQTIFLALRQWDPMTIEDRFKFGSYWTDYALLLLNIFYTFEIMAKVIAWGFWDDSEMFKALNRNYVPIAENLKLRRLYEFFLGRADGVAIDPEMKLKHHSTFQSQTNSEIRIPRAYLRTTWNRLDFVSTISFWINFVISIVPATQKDPVSLFRALECLRIMRMINISDGIGLILKSIKNGGSQLNDVFLFLLYFWVLYSIIGVQSFKLSLRRFCVWIDPNDPSNNYQTDQYCGGHYVRNASNDLVKTPYYLYGNTTLAPHYKGFLCPVGSQCLTLDNSYGNTWGFDNILYSMQMVFVIMSANTFSDIMYATMDSDTMAASIYFMFSIFFLYLWMINLLISVISGAFKSTEEEEREIKNSHDDRHIYDDFDLSWNFTEGLLTSLYLRSKWIFDATIFASLIFSSRIDEFSTQSDIKFEYHAMCVVNIVLLVEIVWRFILYFPNFHTFFKLKRNLVDCFLAFFCAIIVLPYIYQRLGRVYDWLRFFEIVRFYRCVLLVKFVRKLWAQVLRNAKTIVNLSLFYFLLLFLSSIIFSRYLEGFATEDDISSSDLQFPFHSIPNTFLGLFVITSTENWSYLMFNMEALAPNSNALFFTGILFMIWFVFSNSMVLNLFIAIIGDSLEVSENEKRREQVKKFVLVDFPKKVKKLADTTLLSNLRNKIFGDISNNLENKEVETLLLNGAAIQEFLKGELLNQEQELDNDGFFIQLMETKVGKIIYNHYQKLIGMSLIKKIISYFFWNSENYKNPFFIRRNKNLMLDDNYTSLAETFQVETNKTIEEKIQFLKENPGFNTALYIFRSNQSLRRICQKITKPSVGKRYDGVEPNRSANNIFIGIIAITTVLLIVAACYATPLYRKPRNYGTNLWNWTFESELSFALVFLIEFMIKVVADGLIFTPNAYFLNSWNGIDFVVLLSLWVNVIAMVKGNERLSRIVRGLKALRVLRLLTLSETSQDIFHKVMINGVGKIVNGAFLSFTLLYPFSVWGLNLFVGRFGTCNDGNMSKSECFYEFSNTVDQWNVLMPRAYDQPQLEMNSFSSTILTLFEITSLEGWVDLLQNITDSTGVGTPSSKYASPYDAVFIVMFIFVAIIFILTLFVSIIIKNYARLSGSAFFTLQQTSWNEVKKLLSQTNPRKRAERQSLSGIRAFCYDHAIEKSRHFRLTLQVVLWVHILAILLEKYPSNSALDNFRYAIYFTSSTLFLLSILMRIIAIGPVKFLKIRWNIYELFVFLGAFITSLISFFVSRSTFFANVNKLFLVGIFTVVIHMSNRLSHLLKIASASLPSMLSLMVTWCVLFLCFAIAMNQIFGITRLGPNTTDNQNARTVTKALIMLFKMSFGENWNYTMKDFAIEAPFCVSGSDLSLTDCGNEQYAYILFIAWNIISMYIFVNMFISLIFENFSYVYKDNRGDEILTREEIRKFKYSWSKFDPHGTGYISLEQLPRFLRQLDGYFSFKAFDGKWTIPQLSKRYVISSNTSNNPYGATIDIDKMNLALSHLDVSKVCKKKYNYEKFIEEVKLNIEQFKEPGVSFSRVITQIPLYARFDENNCLTLSEFLDRMVITRKLKERLASRRRLATLEMISWRWKFLKDTNRLQAKLKILSKNPFVSPFDGEFSHESSYDQLHTPILVNNESSYWSPTRESYQESGDTKSVDDIAQFADELSHSKWGNDFRSVHSEIDKTLSNFMKQNIFSDKIDRLESRNSEDELYDEKSEGSQSMLEEVINNSTDSIDEAKLLKGNNDRRII
ncbi:hypothetical protein WICMUC_005808 [Wickerhamomyces mucosus]|uniref:Calcium-channel protein CCH1 n=1 Tax=Wickerhamomyces mucosus TaxID=1378264 RepID=A0A9P8P2L7_9ASCO|nr:hypothetical protein WICMUC_005808 [Wickerhamomyces mucosus]